MTDDELRACKPAAFGAVEVQILATATGEGMANCAAALRACEGNLVVARRWLLLRGTPNSSEHRLVERWRALRRSRQATGA